ncbi:MAG TPA: hypothetical protein PLU53_13615 [Bacteroidia bacterium]|nr:hypothetical protein [Bacteroidia bacterium]
MNRLFLFSSLSDVGNEFFSILACIPEYGGFLHSSYLRPFPNA